MLYVQAVYSNSDNHLSQLLYILNFWILTTVTSMHDNKPQSLVAFAVNIFEMVDNYKC